MGLVYLIANDEWTEFKIGKTKSKSERRVSELQTGNGSKISLVKTYETPHYHKVERWLHNKHHNKRLVGEWFSLTDDDIIDFTNECKKAHDTFQMLIDNNNPFI
jgi:hypothetical protein